MLNGNIVHLASALGGVIVIAISIALWIDPSSIAYQYDKLWLGIMGVCYGVFMVIANIYNMFTKEEVK